MKPVLVCCCALLLFHPGWATAERDLPVVVVFTIDFCPSCMATKEWLEQRKIPFHELNVEQSAKARERFDRIDGRGIPTILVGDRRIEGFDERRLRELLPQPR